MSSVASIQCFWATDCAETVYAYAVQATKRVQKALYKNWYVVDADIKGYFDNIDSV